KYKIKISNIDPVFYDLKCSDYDNATTSTSQTFKESIERDEAGANIVVCDDCPQKYSTNTSTEILAEHLNKIHNYGITLKQKRYLVQKPYSKDDTVHIEECESSVLDFFIGDQILFNTAETTEYLSGSSYPTISDVRLTISELIRHFDQFINDRTYLNEECIVADSIHYKLNKYWSLLDEQIIIAAILDPSSKLKTFSSEEKRIAAIAKLHQEII
ncbi:16907_t:CDS:2, partial [Cetraspora pellucida]